MRSGSSSRVDLVPSLPDHPSTRPHASSHASNSQRNQNPVSREIISVGDSAGAALVERLLDETHGSQGYEGSRFSRERFQHLLSVSSRHRERARAAQDAKREGMGRVASKF